MGSLNFSNKENDEEERQIQEQNLLKSLYPGRKLYHRADYIRDIDNSLGEVTVKSFDGYYIEVSTNKGKKSFDIRAIGKYLFLNKPSISKNLMIQGKSELTEEEIMKYKTNDDIFIVEKAFFHKIKSKLQQSYEIVSNKISDLRYGFNDFSYSRDISIYSKHTSYLNEKDIILEMIDKPYFGRLNFSKNDIKTIYIAERSMPEIDKSIYDWRKPICQVYYQQNSIMYDKYGLELIRKFDIHNGSFCGYYDSYIRKHGTRTDKKEDKIINDFLINVIKNQRKNPVIHDIIQTIQNTQYEIISEEIDKNLIIQGCAGSGKTMILMHRLSYIIYNNKNMERKNIKIITPNKNLNFELTDIAKKLQLDDIERCTLNEYYVSLIEKYFERNKIIPVGNLQYYENTTNLSTDDELTTLQLEALYTNDFLNDFSNFETNSSELNELCSLVNSFVSKEKAIICNNRDEFLKDFNDKLVILNSVLREIKRVLRKENRFHLESELNKRDLNLRQVKNKFKQNLDIALSKLKITERETNRSEDNKDYLRIVNSLIKKFSEIKDISKHKELYDVMENLVLSREQRKYIEENNYLGMRPVNVKTDKDRNGIKIKTEISPIDYFKEQIRDKWIRLNQLEEPINRIKMYMQSLEKAYNPVIVDNKEVSQFIEEFNQLTNIVNSLRNFKNRVDNSYLSYIWKVYIDNIKKSNNISLNKKYQFELYGLLQVLFSKFEYINNLDRYLFIDEGQDFLEKELLLLKAINNNPVINIFGDYFQRVRKFGKKYFFQTAREYGFKKYELDVNYRNCKQITEYINKKCNKNMKSVGIDGLVKQIKLGDLTTSVFENMIGRKPLIVKNQDALRKLRQKLKDMDLSNINIIFSSDIKFSATKLNVLNINSSKGLEFPEVIVFDYNLSINELYVACSRALEKLIVIES